MAKRRNKKLRGNVALAQDAQLARSQGLKFKVTRKAAPTARWQTTETDIEDLEQAVRKAEVIDDYESGVIVSFPVERAGFIYWSSSDPDLFNNTVLSMEIHYDDREK